LFNKCPHDLCFLFKVICVYELMDDERGKACDTYEEKRDAYIVLVGKPKGRIPLGRPTRRWKNDIKIFRGLRQPPLLAEHTYMCVQVKNVCGVVLPLLHMS